MATVEQLYAQAGAIASQNGTGLSGRPFGAVITSVRPETEFMNVQHAYGVHSIRVVHPFVGTNHWHRVGPDAGQRVLMHMRMDTKEPSASGYLGADARDTTPEDRIQRYQENKDVYRPLNVGEQEITSTGLAQVFLARRGNLDVRGGYVRGWYDQDNLEAGSRAVTHVRELHLNKVEAVGDEERFGGVTRPDTESKVFRKIISAPEGVPAVPNPAVNASAASDPEAAITSTVDSIAAVDPAKEFMYVLKTSGGVIIDHREGHVVDDSGELKEGKLDGKLRFNKRIYGQLTSDALSGVTSLTASSGTGSDVYEEQVDEKGNMYIGLPPTASKGIIFEIPAGKFSIKSGVASATLDMDGVEQTFKLVTGASSTKVEGSASGLKVHSAQVKIGATEAAVNKVYATTTKKAAQLTLHGGLGGAQLANSVLHIADVAANSALAVINAIVCACPLTPGVVVGLLGVAQAAIPIVMRATNSAIKIAKGGLSGAYVGTQDTHESNTVSISS